MRSSKATLFSFENARVIDRGNSRVRKTLDPGTLQILSRQTIILSNCQDNTQFYCNLIHVITILLSHSFSLYYCIFYLFTESWHTAITIVAAAKTILNFYCNLNYVISILLSHSISSVLLYLFMFACYFLTFLYIYIFTSAF